MTQDEEHVSENNQSVNIVSELPGNCRPFRLTMEIPLFITMLAISLSGPVLSNIILYRTCVHALHHSTEECKLFLVPDKTNTSQQLENEVQKYTTYVSLAKTLIESLGPAVLSLFLGVWSDTYGRKPLVVWPLLGVSISAIMTVVYAMLPNFGPWWFILTAIPFSITGGYTALFTGAFTYMSDITTTENRSFRMTILEAAFSGGSMIGSLASTYLIKTIGSIYVLLVIATLNVIAYVFTSVCLKESLNGALKGSLCTLFELRLVKEMLHTCFKRRPNRGRAQLLLLILANSLSIFILYGLINLSYLYTREKLHWAIKEYSVYSASGTLINVIGAVVGVKLGSQIIGIGDLPLAIVGYITAIGEFITVAFAIKTWHMYLGSCIALLKGLSAPLIRSHITKLLPEEDIAKAFALLCAFEAICPLFSPVLYNSLYRYSIDSFPGAIYILSTFIIIICATSLGTVQYISSKYSSPSYTRLEVEPTNID